MAFIRVGPEDFDPGAEMERLQAEAGDAGAVACFLGIVRRGQERPIAAMTLEHYPAMTERAIARMAAQGRGAVLEEGTSGRRRGAMGRSPRRRRCGRPALVRRALV
jgi:hypothetical protein